MTARFLEVFFGGRKRKRSHLRAFGEILVSARRRELCGNPYCKYCFIVAHDLIKRKVFIFFYTFGAVGVFLLYQDCIAR